MTTRRWIAASMALVASVAVSGCGGDSDAGSKNRLDKDKPGASSGTSSEAPPVTEVDWVLPPQEGLAGAVERIEAAFAADDCDQIVELAWGGGGGLADDAVTDQCAVLEKRLDGGEPATAALGASGGVLQFAPDGASKATRAVLVVGDGGLFRPVFYDYVPASEKLSAEGRPGPFMEAAQAVVDALGAGDCDALAAVSHYTHPRSWVCDLTEASLAQSLASKERGFTALGATGEYALFAVRARNVYWVLVMARQPEHVESNADGYSKKKSPEYVLANIVRLDSP